MTTKTTRLATATALLAGLIAGCAGPAQPATAPPVNATGSGKPVVTGTANPAPVTGTDQALDQLSTDEMPWWQQSPRTPVPRQAAGAGKSRSTRFVLSGGVLFEPDTPILTAGAGSQLAVILAAAQSLPGAIIIVDGYTNKIPGANTHRSLQISQQRADTVKAWLVTRGIKPGNIRTHGWGDSRPLNPGNTEAERAANRRCEITITAPRD